jgi:hypothetical protein
MLFLAEDYTDDDNDGDDDDISSWSSQRTVAVTKIHDKNQPLSLLSEVTAVCSAINTKHVN